MMKNTLRYALLVIGFLLILFGLAALFFPNLLGEHFTRDRTQFMAMTGFGLLCLISGMAYKRR